MTAYVGFSYGQDQVGRTGLPRDLWRTKQTTSGRIGVTFVVFASMFTGMKASGGFDRSNVASYARRSNACTVPCVACEHDAMHLKAPLLVLRDPMLLTTRHSREATIFACRIPA